MRTARPALTLTALVLAVAECSAPAAAPPSQSAPPTLREPAATHTPSLGEPVAETVLSPPSDARRTVLGLLVSGITYRRATETSDPAHLVRYAVVPDAPATLHVNAKVSTAQGGPVAERITVAQSREAPTPTARLTPTASPRTRTAPTKVNCATVKCVALTYDDGPSDHTALLLDHLKRAKAPATFFMLGRSAQAQPDLVRRAAAEGHLIENHTVDHRSLDRLPLGAQRWEADTAAAALRGISGQPVTLLRPPFGAYNANTRRLGIPLILWDVDTQDWKNRDATITTRRALATVRPGSIILMHDIHRSSVDATPGIIRALRKRGFTLVSVDTLLGKTTPGAVYRRR